MKALEWVMLIGGLVASGALVAVVVFVAMLPYLAFGAVVMVCFRYLGWL